MRSGTVVQLSARVFGDNVQVSQSLAGVCCG